MNYKFHFCTIMLCLLLSMAGSVTAQSLSRDKKSATAVKENADYGKYPYWISMMHDPAVNYFDALEAYDAFWKNREKPVLEEEELMGTGADAANEHRQKLNKRELREQQELQQYAYDVKYFEHWKRSVEPYVQSDGRILSSDERLQIWYEQRNR